MVTSDTKRPAGPDPAGEKDNLSQGAACAEGAAVARADEAEQHGAAAAGATHGTAAAEAATPGGAPDGAPAAAQAGSASDDTAAGRTVAALFGEGEAPRAHDDADDPDEDLDDEVLDALFSESAAADSPSVLIGAPAASFGAGRERRVPDRALLSDAAAALYERAAAPLDADVTTVLPRLTDDMVRQAAGRANLTGDRTTVIPAAPVSAATAPSAAPAAAGAPALLPRVDAIWNHALFQRHYQALLSLERDRPFCRHGIAHLLDVARLAWIENLEQGLGFDRELVYAAALLHDVGKAVQYTNGTPHEVAGEKIASSILATLPDDASFTTVQARQILTAVRGHRHLRADATPLERLIYAADKRSRACFACAAADRCNWAPERRNNVLNW